MTTAVDPLSAIRLEKVSVRFQLPAERIVSFKEYVLRRLSGRIDHRDLWALHEVDLVVPPGQMLGIIGRNGAGKSTLLKVISRVLRPTAGRVVVRGRTAPLLELGAGFHFDLTGRENIYLNATLFGYGRDLISRHLHDIVGFSELGDFIDLPIRNYSNGMLARLGFAVATQFRPDILILDEILAVGDTGFQEKCLQRIDRFRTEGTSILLVSHDLDRIRASCEAVVWIEHGRLIAQGPPAELLDAYRDGFASALP